MSFKNRIRSIIVLCISIICMTLLLHNNREILFVYYNYAEYKLSSENNDSMASIDRTINAAKEAGYTCKNNYSPVVFAVKEIQKRTHRKFVELINYSQVSKSNCVILPTGEIFMIIGDGIVRYHILLKEDAQRAERYYILDIKGKVIG